MRYFYKTRPFIIFSGSDGCSILRETGHFIACLHFWALKREVVGFPKYHVMKTYRTVGGRALPFLNSLLEVCFNINAPAYLSPQQKFHCSRGQMNPRAGLGMVVKRKLLLPVEYLTNITIQHRANCFTE
jgi:hypothetical protein